MNPMYLRDEDPGDEDEVSPEVQQARDDELDTDFCPKCDTGLLIRTRLAAVMVCDRCGYREDV